MLEYLCILCYQNVAGILFFVGNLHTCKCRRALICHAKTGPGQKWTIRTPAMPCVSHRLSISGQDCTPKSFFRVMKHQSIPYNMYCNYYALQYTLCGIYTHGYMNGGPLFAPVQFLRDSSWPCWFCHYSVPTLS